MNLRRFLSQKWVRILLAIEVVLLGMTFVKMFLPLKSYEFGYNDFAYNDGIILDGQGLFVDNSMSEKGYFIYGPSVNIDKGIYDVTISYETNCYENYLILAGANENYNSLHYDDANINPFFTEKTITCYVNKDINGFSVSVVFDGTGELLVKNIEVSEKIAGRIHEVVIILFWILIVNCIAWFGTKVAAGEITRSTINITFIFAIVCIFASYPLFNTFFLEGHDSTYHLLRIEGIVAGLLSGQFPVRIHPIQFNGYGYANSIFYGEIFLYFPALLRLCGFTLQDAYKIFVVFINIVTLAVSYKCFKVIFKNRNISALCAVFYVLCPYRLTNIYVRSAVGEYCAMIFWPIIFVGLYRLFTEDYNKIEFKNIWIVLTIGYSGLIQTHLISCELAAFASVALCLVMIKKVLVKERICELVKFFCITILLNSFYLVPFLDYMLEGGILAVDKGSLQGSAIQETGVHLAHYYNLFNNGNGYIYRHGTVGYTELGIADEMGSTLGLTLIAGIVVFGYIYLTEYKKAKCKQFFGLANICFVGGVLMLYLSTNLFPWDSFSRNLGNIVSNIQFPIRLLSLAAILLTVLVGCVLYIVKEILGNEIYSVMCSVLILINVITAGYMMYNKLDTSHAAYVYDFGALNVSGSGSMSEYLLTEAENYEFYYENAKVVGDLEISNYTKEYTNISFDVNATNGSGFVQVPLLAYKGYEATLDGLELEVLKSENGIMQIIISNGVVGKVNVRYAGMWYWHVAELVSIITVIFMLIYLGRIFNKTNRVKR